MFDKYFSLIYDFVKNKKWLVLGIIILLTTAASIGLRFNEFDGNIELMLPDDSGIRRSISFLRDSNLSDKVIISLALTSPEKTKKDLFLAVDQLAASLNPPLFSKVTTGFSDLGIMDDIFFFDYAPQIITETELAFIDSQINPVSVSERLGKIYRQLLKPESIFMTSMIQSDPLGVRLLLLDKFKALSVSTGYNVNIEDGHFISSDGRHSMIITQTPVLLTDSSGSKKLMRFLKEQLRQLPEYISADIIGGHLHTLSNERVIKRDIRLTLIIASFAFLLLFLIIFRDIRAVFVFLIPLASVIISINISNFFIGKLAYWVIGLGTVIAGISIDYGIHVYVAVRNGGNTSEVIKLVAKPVSICALTTLGVFFAFFFSNIRGYHQLAFFSILSIIFSLLYALFILPHFLSRGKFFSMRNPKISGKPGRFHWSAKLTVVLWAFSIAVALLLSFYVKFDSNIAQLDGSEPEIFRAEKNFHQVWGGQDNQAILVVTGKSYEEALETNDIIYQEMAQTVGAEQFSSLVMLWPSEKTRRENAARWSQFWSKGREAKLKKLLKEEGAKYQFSEYAFAPFFDNLYTGISVDSEPADDEFLSILKERFVQKKQDEYRTLSFFPDEKKYLDILSNLSEHHSGTFLVSRKVLSQAISNSTFSEVKFLGIIAAIFIVLLTFLFLKNFKEALIALIPVITSFLWLLGFLSLSGLTLNIANLVAGIVVMGICIDYGIFMTYKSQHELKAGTIMAVSLSAATTFVGAGVLLFAEHPALFSIGITLVIGVLAGYLSSVFVIPAFQRILSTSEEHQ